jgi:hypothetical protein
MAQEPGLFRNRLEEGTRSRGGGTYQRHDVAENLLAAPHGRLGCADLAESDRPAKHRVDPAVDEQRAVRGRIR